MQGRWCVSYRHPGSIASRGLQPGWASWASLMQPRCSSSSGGFVGFYSVLFIGGHQGRACRRETYEAVHILDGADRYLHHWFR